MDEPHGSAADAGRKLEVFEDFEVWIEGGLPPSINFLGTYTADGRR